MHHWNYKLGLIKAVCLKQDPVAELDVLNMHEQHELRIHSHDSSSCLEVL